MKHVNQYAMSWVRRAGTALIICGLVALPQSAVAATKVRVDEQEFEEASGGQGWTWDGADDMALDGFVGKTIAAVGDLLITLSNENSVANTSDGATDAAISVSEGNLTITGTGELSVTSDTSGIVADGNIDVGGGATVVVEADNKGVSAGDDLTVDDASVKITVEDGTALKAGDAMSIRDARVVASSRSGKGIEYGKEMSVDNATVGALAGNDGIHGNGDLTATDSTITATSDMGQAISPNGSIVIDHSTVKAESASGDMAISAWNDETPSTITITDSKIVDPEGGQVAVFVEFGTVLGQTISRSAVVERGVRSVTGIESSVFIEATERVPEPEKDTATTDYSDEPPEDLDIAGGSGGRGAGLLSDDSLDDREATLLAQTGDPTSILAIEMLAAGGLLSLVSGLVRRRED